MGKETEGCLNPADNDGDPFEGLPNTVGEDDNGPVRPDLVANG